MHLPGHDHREGQPSHRTGTGQWRQSFNYPMSKHYVPQLNGNPGNLRRLLRTGDHRRRISASKYFLSQTWKRKGTPKLHKRFPIPPIQHTNTPVSSTIRKKDTKSTNPLKPGVHHPSTGPAIPRTGFTPTHQHWKTIQETRPGGRGPPPPHSCTTQCTTTGKAQ